MIRTAIAVSAAGIATAASMVTISLYSKDRDARQQDINVAVCTAVAKLDSAITASLERSLANIGKLQYYKDHPEEKVRQIAEIERSLRDFKPPPECGRKVVGT